MRDKETKTESERHSGLYFHFKAVFYVIYIHLDARLKPLFLQIEDYRAKMVTEKTKISMDESRIRELEKLETFLRKQLREWELKYEALRCQHCFKTFFFFVADNFLTNKLERLSFASLNSKEQFSFTPKC